MSFNNQYAPQVKVEAYDRVAVEIYDRDFNICKVFYKSNSDLERIKQITEEVTLFYNLMANESPEENSENTRQDPRLKSLLKKSVELSKSLDSLPEAVRLLEQAFEIDKEVKQLTLYHYKRISAYLYKLKRYDEGFSWVARLTQGIPSQQPADHPDWYQFYADIIELTAQRLISEPTRENQCNALGEALQAIKLRHQAAKLRIKRAKSLQLCSFISSDEIFLYCGLKNHGGPLILPSDWYQAYHEVFYNYQRIKRDIHYGELVAASLADSDSDDWGLVRKVLKKLKGQHLEEGLIRGLSSALQESDYKAFSETAMIAATDIISMHGYQISNDFFDS